MGYNDTLTLAADTRHRLSSAGFASTGSSGRVRWWLTILSGVGAVALGFSACSTDDANSTRTPTTTTTGQQASSEVAAERELPLLADVVRAPGGEMSSLADSLVVQPPSGSALLAFGALPAEPDCIEAATLRVQGHGVRIPVYAWVSLETGLVQLSDGASLGSYVVAPGAPDAISTAEGDDLILDITDLLRWSRAHQSTSEVFVVVLKAGFHTTSGPAEFGAMEADEGAVLTVEERAACTEEGQSTT